MKDLIKNYLSGSRLYNDGVSLYERFGNNMALKRAFRMHPESKILRLTLYEELRKLAGLSEMEYKDLPRNSVPTPSTAANDTGKYTPVSDHEDKKIRFRERFSFLKSADCPNILKVLVNDMFASYDAYREAHNELSSLRDDAPLDKSAILAATAVEEMLNDRMIWNELQYYQDNKKFLGSHPKVEDHMKWIVYREMSDFDLIQTLKNAGCNISKHKKKMECASSEEERQKHEASMREWINVKLICNQEIERRKNGE